MAVSRTVLDVVRGDITKLSYDVIVNAANSSLLGGGGVDGAIHRAAGKDLVHECRLLGGCKTGQAKVTKGYDLPSKWIVHTVGPVWRGGFFGERDQLADCYRNSLECAKLKQARTVAFPAISTGIFKFPLDEAAPIAIATVRKVIAEDAGAFERITFVCFDDVAKVAFVDALGNC